MNIHPAKDAFVTLAAKGNVIPVYTDLMADFETPVSAYAKLKEAGPSYLFESVEGGEHLGRYSFVGCNPRAVVRQTGQRVEVVENGKVVQTHEVAAVPGGGAAPCAMAWRRWNA